MVNIQYNSHINIALHHDITQRTHARLFLERIDAFLPSFSHPSEEHQFEFEFEFNCMHLFDQPHYHTILFQGRVFLFHTTAMVFYKVCLPPVLSSRVVVVLKWPNNLLPFNLNRTLIVIFRGRTDFISITLWSLLSTKQRTKCVCASPRCVIKAIHGYY